MSKVWLRWAPAAAAVVVVAGAAIAVPTVANASVSLPVKTPTQVLELVASSQVRAFSGTVEETSDLGLPSLPTGGVPSSAQGSSGGGVTSADIALLTGPNSLRVYVDGPTKARVQDLESLAERDVIRNGSDVWVYDSKDNSVAHASLESRQHFVRPGAAPQATTPDPTDSTPSGLAKKLIAQLEPTSNLSVDASVRVAGRASYDLVLTPKVSDTLIGSVSIAVDAQTGLPLRVQIDARGQKTPAVSIGFSSLDLSTPSASLFAFTPPAGSKVTELKKDASAPPAAPGTAVKKPAETVTGHGWDAVVTIAAASSLGKLSQSPEFGELTTAVDGGRLLHTSLFNILFTTDGRIVAGSVSVARLQEAASAK